MRQIKFRGRDLDSGELVFGDLIHDGTGNSFLVQISESRCFRIAPDSISQFIAFDINDHEVFEGDLVTRIAGDDDFDPEKAFPVQATFDDFFAILTGDIILI